MNFCTLPFAFCLLTCFDVPAPLVWFVGKAPVSTPAGKNVMLRRYPEIFSPRSISPGRLRIRRGEYRLRIPLKCISKEEERSMAQFCTKCGSPMSEGMQFCTVCGATVGQASAPRPVRPHLPRRPRLPHLPRSQRQAGIRQPHCEDHPDCVGGVHFPRRLGDGGVHLYWIPGQAEIQPVPEAGDDDVPDAQRYGGSAYAAGRADRVCERADGTGR